MTHAVQAVVDERKGSGTLDENLGSNGKSAKSGSDGGRFKVPTEQRRGEVCGCEKVQGARKSNAGDTVSARANPGDLGTVDGEVRGNGAIQALLGEDFGGISLRCGGSSVSGHTHQY